MKRVRIFACAAAGLALAALGWFLSDAPGALANVSADILNRSAGLALLGVAMIATGLVFRAATRAEQKPALATTRPSASEYRRGFGGRMVQAQPQVNQPTQRGVILSLRRAVAEQGNAPASVETGAVLPMREIEQLRNMLRIRAVQRCAPSGADLSADLTKRHFTRSVIDHGYEPQ